MKIIKLSKYIIIIIIIIINMFGLVACSAISIKQEVFSEGNFLYYNYDEFVTIIGFTEEGRKQKEIVFPTEIDGKKVDALGNSNITLIGTYGRNYFHQDEDEYGECLVEKIFIPKGIAIKWINNRTPFVGCSFLKKVLFVSTEPLQNYIYELGVGITRIGEERVTNITNLSGGEKIIVPYGHIGRYKNMYEGYFIEANIQFELNYEVENAEELIAQYEKEHIDDYDGKELIAKYRNDITNNEGIYWIDYLEVNEKLTTIPNDPVREGYTFGGWYAEAECINLIDLNTFVKGEGSAEFFAKWDNINLF